MKKPVSRQQMSDALPTVVFLTMSGGLQDAYSYCVRGQVFANAQTGNIVLMSQHLFMGQWSMVLRYLIPICAFACGVFVAEQVKARYQRLQAVHWRQLIVLGEIALLLVVGFLPGQADYLANALTSFACAMQVQAFRKVNGNAYASTMCIGNLRSGVEAFSAYLRTKNRALIKKSGQYFGVIFLFALGAGLGGVLSANFGRRTIWISCGLLLFSFVLMFIREDIEADPAIEGAVRQLRRDDADILDQTALVGNLLKDELHREETAIFTDGKPRGKP